MYIFFRKVYKGWNIVECMKRKLVKQGAATMMVSLPSKWIKSNDLNKGDEVDVEERDGNLLLRTSSVAESKKEVFLEVSPDNKDDFKNLVLHAYKRGADRIVIRGVSKDFLKVIKRISRFLLGFEMTDQAGDTVILESLTEPSDGTFNIMIRKIFLVLQDQIDDVVGDFSTGSYDNEKEVDESFVNGVRLIQFCRRLLTKESRTQMSVLQWGFVTNLSMVHAELDYMYKYGKDKKLKVDKNVINLLKEYKDNYLELLYQMYIGKKIEDVHKIRKLSYDYQYGKCYELLEKSKGGDSVILAFIREIFKLTYWGRASVYSDIMDKMIKG
jgi:phosphate uptake regulator|tara:strand:+ start:7711 stop:8691 length:981 start_codon:yes stop_codon:yes gene_type:complete